jgi:xylulokinase
MYLPYLLGERSPRWNPDASGAFLGMRMAHTKAHYIRAVLEGIALNLNVILEAQRKNGDIRELILTGGGAEGDVVAQILADVTGCRIIRPDHVEESTSMAAAVLAGIGAGIYDGFDAISEYIHYGEPLEPDRKAHAVYEKEMKIFNEAYEALKPIYPEMRGSQSS